MKNRKTQKQLIVSALALIFIGVTAIFITNCTKPQIKNVHDTIPNKQGAKTDAIDTLCNCEAPHIGECGSRKCAKDFLGGSFSKTFSVSWNEGCTLGWTGTTVDLCYNRHCVLEAKFHDLPPCLQDCLQEDACYILGFTCSSTAVANGDDQAGNGSPVHISIIGDPIITITCNGTDYTGTLN